MKIIKKAIDVYVRTLKLATTFLGVFLIYFIGIFIGKIIYLFTTKTKVNKWSTYQTGASPFKMY